MLNFVIINYFLIFLGDRNSGHYISYCKQLNGNDFFEFNDHLVVKMKNFSELQEKIKKNCYILAFEKKNTLDLTLRNIILNRKNSYNIQTRAKAIEEKMQKKKNRESEKQISKSKKNEKLLSFNKENLLKCQNGNSRDKKYATVFLDINETPSIVCDCCYRLGFAPESKKYNIQKLYKAFGKKCKEENTIDFLTFSKKINRPLMNKERFLCSSCYETISKGSIPIYGPENGIIFEPLSQNLLELTDLEERLICPIIPFGQVRDLKPYSLNTFEGMKGPVINIKIDMHDAVTVLPRKFNEISVKQIMLKRHLNHKTFYMYDTINVKRVMDALKELIDKPLYKDIKLLIDEKAFNEYDALKIGEHINFVVDKSLIDDEELKFFEVQRKKNINISELRKKLMNGESFDSIIENYDLNAEEKKQFENIINDFDFDDAFFGNEGRDNDVLIYEIPINPDFFDENEKNKESKKKNNIDVIAPGAGKTPTLAKDIEFYHERIFPSKHGGVPLKYNREKISKIKCFKHQIQQYDRRFTVPKYLFSMSKYKIEVQLQNGISIACRVGKCSNLTVKDVLNGQNLKNLCSNDEAYRYFRNITIFPSYLQSKFKDIMGCFRQLGMPSVFLTLGPAESFWPSLLKQLFKNKYGSEISDIDALNLSDQEKGQLIKNDPVLCVQFFNRRSKKLADYFKIKNNKIFNDNYVVDSITRLEYQLRGFSHTHRILYLKDFPVYDKNITNDNWIVLRKKIDELITTEYDVNNPHIVHQVHMCTFTCSKYKKGVYQFK